MSRRELVRALARAIRVGSLPQATAAYRTPWAGAAQAALSRLSSPWRAHSTVASWPSARGPIERALTPPNTWYTSPSALDADMSAVFARSWLIAGRAEQVSKPGDFFTGRVMGLRFVCVRGDDGQLRAFHNLCRHNAASVASGAGCAQQFQCPYHGWTYDLRGRLRKATRLAGIEDFSAKNYGLVPLQVEQWSHFVLINASPTPVAAAVTTEGDAGAGDRASAGSAASGSGRGAEPGAGAGAGSFKGMLADAGNRLDSFADSLRFVVRKEYHIACNWKVFCNNYLDGGYHVPFAHGDLAAGIDMGTYKTEVFSQCSLQSTSAAAAAAGGDDRLGTKALYAFVWPNAMINRYGPWMDVNIVVPTGPESCTVLFDYFIDPCHPRAGDAAYVAECLAASEQVQREDVALCEDVQQGLRSPGYLPGRYAPRVEGACFHYHQLLEGAYRADGAPAAAGGGRRMGEKGP